MSQQRQQKFLGLYQPVHDRFERFCRARVGGEMPYPDLINESLLVAYKKMGELRNEEAFLSFLIGIATRILANSRRKKKTYLPEDDLIFKNYAAPDNAVEKQFEIELLHKALAQLPEKQREALILFEITGFNIKEIMEIQGSGQSAVKQRLARGRKALARIVKELMAYRK